MAKRKTPGEVMFDCWVERLPVGSWLRNTYWADLDAEDHKKWERQAKKVADAYNAAHAPKG